MRHARPSQGLAQCLSVMAVVLLLIVSGCRDTGKDGEYFVLDGKLFVFNYRVATATYLVNIKPVRPVGEGQVAVATFENPAGGEAIVVREKIWPRMDKTTINSPPVQCIVKDRPYAVSIRIEDAAGVMLQQIDTTMTSTQDQSLLPDKPLVVGPFYTPNPEASSKAGQPTDGQSQPCPKV